MTGVRDYSTGELKHNVVALAKAAKALQLPIILTSSARDSMWGPTFPELVEALPGVPIIDRSSVNALDDTEVARAVTETGRTKLIFAGISLEGSTLRPDNDANKKLYGKEIKADEIVLKHAVKAPTSAHQLLASLNKKSPRHQA